MGHLLLPNTFSPNGDRLNDVFRIYGFYRGLLELSVIVTESGSSTQPISQEMERAFNKRCRYLLLPDKVDADEIERDRKGRINLVY